MPQLLRIFISSPSDVEVERQIALQVIHRLGLKYQNSLALKAILWEREPLLASGHFQDALDPGSADIMVCILWSRLGSPLPDSFTGPDGRTGITGTEWEFEHALAAIEKKGKPDLMVYRKTSELTGNFDNHQQAIQTLEQKQQLDAYFDKHFHNQDEAHTFKRAFFPFESSDIFEQQLEIHLAELVEKHLNQNQKQQTSNITWHQGSPFRGLETFDQEHQAIFFGRTQAIGQIMAQYKDRVHAQQAFLMLLGMSGSGKSSLLNAGLLPLIQTPRVVQYEVGHIRQIKLRPGLCEHSLGPLVGLCQRIIEALPELAVQGLDAETLEEQILNSPKTLKNTFQQVIKTVQQTARLHKHVTARLQLVIDQFEELFTNKSYSEQQREIYCQGIQALIKTGTIWCIASMRSDFISAAEGSTLIELMRGQGQYTLQPPKPHEIEQIIRQPAQAAGLSYENNQQGQSLDTVIREATQNQPGVLPLLQFCLKELFIHRNTENQQLTLSAYEHIGKIEGAISQRAEQELEQLKEQVDLKAALPKIFHALISINPDNEETATSRYMSANEFSADSDENQIIQALIKARLLVTSGDENQVTIRIAHEALITHWQRVKEWILRDIEFLKWHARTEREVHLWQQDNKIKARLLPKGKPLADAESFLQTREGDIHSQIKPYLQASIKQEKIKQRVSWVVTGGIFIILSGLAGWAYNKSIVAEKQKVIAEEKTRQANHNIGLVFVEKAKISDKENKHERARLYALTALPLLIPDKNPLIDIQARSISTKNINSSLVFRLQHKGLVSAVAFSADGRTLATGSGNSSVNLWDVTSGEVLRVFSGHENKVTSVAFSLDGKLLASGSTDNTVHLWHIDSNKEPVILKGHTKGVTSVAFSPDGNTLASASLDETVRIWNVVTGKEISLVDNYIMEVRCVAFSPDGKMLSVCEGYVMSQWDVANNKAISSVMIQQGIFSSAAYSPRGKSLASSEGHTVNLWDVDKISAVSEEGGRIQGVYSDKKFEGHIGVVNSVSFSPDGKLLVSGSADNTMRLWDVTNRKVLKVFEGHTGDVTSVAFSPDGKTLASGSTDSTVRLWDIAKITRAFNDFSNFKRNNRFVSFSLSVDGETVAMGGKWGNLLLWDVASDKPLSASFGEAYSDVDIVYSVAISPDGKTLASVSDEDLSVQLWDIASGQSLAILSGHENRITNVAFSPDGKTLASGSADKTVRLWSVNTHKLSVIFKGHTAAVTSIGFSPDGNTLASGSADKTIRLWDVGSHKAPIILEGHTAGVSSISFSSDGMTLASGGDDYTIRLWNVRSGTVLSILERFQYLASSIVFSPDGKNLASGHWGGSVRLWDIKNGKGLVVFKRHQSPIHSVAFSLDGTNLTSVSRDLSVELWDTATFKRVSNPQYYVEKLSNQWGLQLQGLDIVSFKNANNLDNNSNSAQAVWSKQHPFHWLPKAKQGDGNSMIELGNIYLRDTDIVKARDWFEKAKGLSGFEEIAEERLKLTESVNSRLKKNN